MLILTGFVVTAQTISLEFPYFAGKTYEFKIVQGGKQIVLQNGTIGQDGKVILQIPPKYKGYKGMAMWYLTNSEKGGGLEMVINNEDFSVACLDSIPTTESIIYKNTLENTFLHSNYQEQQTIFEKHDAMLYATRAYKKDHSLYPIFATEYDTILKKYTQFVERLKNTPLYAARFREITNITMGIGSIITQDEYLKAQNINSIIINQMDFEVLYTSNHWTGIINSFVQLQSMVLKNDVQFATDAKTILGRMPTVLYTDFVSDLTKALTKAGKDNIIAALTSQIKNANKLLNYNGVLNVYQKDLSGKAPNLIISNQEVNAQDSNKENTIIDFVRLKNKYTLLVFYKSGCGPCDDLMAGLASNYKNLTSKGIEIITIAADTEEAVFKNSTAQQPWAKKYCDFQGTNGINFKNYAVLGTPTLYLLNQKGIIIQKMHGLQELLDVFAVK
jgi:thiol-disulfide isomerase/thioredoxin